MVCLDVLALRQTGELSRVYPASHPKAAVIGSSPLATLGWMESFSLVSLTLGGSLYFLLLLDFFVFVLHLLSSKACLCPVRVRGKRWPPLPEPLHSHILRAPSLCFTVGTIRSDIIHEPSLTQICIHQIKLRTSTGLAVHLPSTSISRDFFIKPDSRSLHWTDEMRLWFNLCEGLMLAPSWAAVNWWFLKL